MGWGGGVFVWEKEKTEDVLGWGLYLGEKTKKQTKTQNHNNNNKKQNNTGCTVDVGWGEVFIWEKEKN